MTAPTHLRVEHLGQPLGITVPTPRLSWWLPDGATIQHAYQIRAGVWDSGRVESGRSVLVPYRGPALGRGERVDWTVKVWTDAGESDWAEPQWWEMGLLTPSDWSATWITPDDQSVAENDPRRAWLFRAPASLGAPVQRARLYVTAHGIYEFFVNGRRVGDLELTPGFTSYWSTLQVQTFDVTELMRSGPNTWGAIVSGGWLKWTRRFRDAPVALLAQLHVHLADGTTTRLGTGPDWQTTTGAVRTADLWEGQVVDHRSEPLDWCAPGGDDEAGWTPVRTRYYDMARLQASPAPPVRRVQELPPVAVNRPRPDRQVIDLGQNINGWVRVTGLGPAGSRLTLTHGESIDDDGDVTVEHITGTGADDAPPFQTDQVISSGRVGEVFEPRHTTHGFRYVRIEGDPADLDGVGATGIVVHTDLRRTGSFECSDKRVNELHEAAVWSFRGNACDIPTDCPTRERAGWTGDWQLFVSTAAFLYDVAGFATKWLHDLASDQLANGVVLHCAPEATPIELQTAACMPPGSAGWGDAAVIVPWEIYRAYGDVDLLSEQWPSMTAWVEYAARLARQRRHHSRHLRNPQPAPHERYLWDTGFHWGEWLEPDASLEASPEAIEALFEMLNTADHGCVATAYLHHSADLLARIATLLGRESDAARYEDLARQTKAAWQLEFLRSDGTITPDTQASYVRALAFDLVPDRLRHRLAARLVALVRANGTHLGTGFLATPYLLPVLADNGYADVAYQLLLQDSEPSWITMIDRGATTIWEHWNGVDEQGRAHHSLNHYSKGAVVSFLHRYTAGLQLLDDAAAYRRFRIAPTPGGGITSASAEHESPYGRIETHWSIQGDQFEFGATIPPGTTAEIRLPDGSTIEAGPGTVARSVSLAGPALPTPRPDSRQPV